MQSDAQVQSLNTLNTLINTLKKYKLKQWSFFIYQTGTSEKELRRSSFGKIWRDGPLHVGLGIDHYSNLEE